MSNTEKDNTKKKVNLIRIGNRRPLISLKEAISRVYEVKGYKDNVNKTIRARIEFPSILIGHKVKLVLIK